MTLIPWTLKKSAISGAKPQINEPIRKTTIAAWNIGRRPRRSEILPQSGVAAVEVSRYAVTTHESLSRPPNSEVILGRATATMLWSRAARNMPAINPPMTTRIWRWLR